MEPMEQWERYAACWSMASTERGNALHDVVDQVVTYRDPGTTVAGLVAFGEYMDSFGSAFPGARFVIDDVLSHHGALVGVLAPGIGGRDDHDARLELRHSQ
jgi:predicted ester cyclase